ncbi:hypothetical protein SprV_0702452500 [Sparganum proliferum]
MAQLRDVRLSGGPSSIPCLLSSEKRLQLQYASHLTPMMQHLRSADLKTIYQPINSRFRGSLSPVHSMNHPENAAAPPADGRPAPSQATNKRFQQTQAQVNEVVDIMRVNMEKVLERDAALGKLDDRADALQAGASQFEASAGKLKNKYWWKNMKMTLAIGAVGLILVIALGWYIFGGKKTEEAAPEAPTTGGPGAEAASTQPAGPPPSADKTEAGPKARSRRSPPAAAPPRPYPIRAAA